MKKNSLSEFEMEKEGFKIKLRRASEEGRPEEVQVQHYLPPAVPVPAAPAEVPVAAPVSAPAPATDPEIKSPMIGTFYRKPSPESESYVEVGDTVTADMVVCIIEAMKVMNEIKAEMSGDRGQPPGGVRPAAVPGASRVMERRSTIVSQDPPNV